MKFYKKAVYQTTPKSKQGFYFILNQFDAATQEFYNNPVGCRSVLFKIHIRIYVGAKTELILKYLFFFFFIQEIVTLSHTLMK